MKTYARIQSGLVAELFSTDGDIAEMFHPAFVWVDVTAVTPQPMVGWGASETNAVWSFSAPAAPSPAQLASAALSAGLTISSTGTPAINGAYAVDALSQADIVAIETSLNAGRGFPGGATTFNYPDMAGAMHTFSEANFTNFAAAVRDYVYALKSVAAEASNTLPSSSAVIA